MDNKRGKIDMSTHKPKYTMPKQTAKDASDANLKPDKPAIPSEHMLGWVEQNHPGKAQFTIAETAKITGMSEDFIRDHINSGNIQAVNMGTKIRVTLYELARILEQGVK